jgi:hypothetical protein
MWVQRTAIIAAVAFITATIAQDILTMGVGVLDDGATFALALSLVRIAKLL